MLKELIYRVLGAPPPSGATREERPRWIRKFYRLALAAIAVVVILALVDGGTFFWILAATGAVMWAGGVASISMSIRREGSNGA